MIVVVVEIATMEVGSCELLVSGRGKGGNGSRVVVLVVAMVRVRVVVELFVQRPWW